MDVTLNDFKPFNVWKPDLDGEKWQNGEPKYLVDQSTGRKYFNESTGCVRFKCFLLTLGTPIVHTIAAIVNIAYRILKLISLSHFWLPKKGEESYDFKARLLDARDDLIRIALQPIAIFALELAAIYGVFMPYDGRKLYATIERGEYGNFILAPCFQPGPTNHLFGGDVNQKDAF